MKRAGILILLAASCFSFYSTANAHEVRPAYLELRQIDPETYDVLWKIPAIGGEMRLSIHVRMPGDVKRLPMGRGTFSGDAFIERWRVQRPGGLGGQTIHIDGLTSTKIDVLARVVGTDGATQTTLIKPDSPSFVVETKPGAWKVSITYLELGVEHILLGIDHLLFVLALLLLVRGWKPLVGAITAFTAAHSITLAAATLGFVHVPGPPVEACIALSIVFVAAEIIRERQGQSGITARAPWLVAFTFGLLHGLGFAGALTEVGLPMQAIPLALLFFNVGVELGQLAFVAVVLIILAVVRRTKIPAPAWSWRIAPYAIGSLAMFWVIQRTAGFVS